MPCRAPRRRFAGAERGLRRGRHRRCAAGGALFRGRAPPALPSEIAAAFRDAFAQRGQVPTSERCFPRRRAARTGGSRLLQAFESASIAAPGRRAGRRPRPLRTWRHREPPGKGRARRPTWRECARVRAPAAEGPSTGLAPAFARGAVGASTRRSRSEQGRSLSSVGFLAPWDRGAQAGRAWARRLRGGSRGPWPRIRRLPRGLAPSGNAAGGAGLAPLSDEGSRGRAGCGPAREARVLGRPGFPTRRVAISRRRRRWRDGR